MMTMIVAPFLSALALSLLLVPIARYGAVRFGFVAKPRADRWHRRPVALFGGAAIAVSLFVCAVVFHVVQEIPVIVLAAAAMFTAGLADDVFSLKPSTKLVVQIALASVLLFFDYRLNWLHSTFDTVLTLVWIVGLTNAFNLLDNMDGLCAGIAIIVGAALLIDLLPGSGPQVFSEARFLAILLGATGGFLVYNVHPASIFMGDSGSLMLGFSLAAATLSSQHPTQGRSDVLSIVAAPVLVLLIPIFDTTLVTLSRWFSGRSASQGGRDHSSHRLVAIGLSERGAVALLWMLAAVGGGLGIALDYWNQSWWGLVAVAFLLAMILFAVYLAGIRVYEDTDERVKAGALTPIVVDFMYKRRVAEVLLDFGLVTLCYYTAYRIRFEDAAEFTANFDAFSRSLPLVLGAQMVAFFAVGIYRGMWRHFGMMDSLAVARGVFFGTVTAQVVILYVYRFAAYSRTVFVIHGVLLLMAVVLTRASVRMASEYVQRQRQSGRRVVIYGAGDAGPLVIRELIGRDDRETRILGFVDDDPRRAGIRIQGYPVLGGYSALAVLARASSVDSVVISARHMPPERLNNLETLCSECNIRLSRLRVGIEAIVEADEDTVPRPRATVHQIKS